MKRNANRIELARLVGHDIFTPQTNAIGNHLVQVGTITGVEASAMYKARSLPRRIKDLRDAGIRIESKVRMDMTGQRYTKYVLA